jgi:hypothetical protein
VKDARHFAHVGQDGADAVGKLPFQIRPRLPQQQRNGTIAAAQAHARNLPFETASRRHEGGCESERGSLETQPLRPATVLRPYVMDDHQSRQRQHDRE